MASFKKGDKVKIVNCIEANFPENQKIWVCIGDSFTSASGEEVVFLEGKRSYFCCEFLEIFGAKND